MGIVDNWNSLSEYFPLFAGSHAAFAKGHCSFEHIPASTVVKWFIIYNGTIIDFCLFIEKLFSTILLYRKLR